MDIQFVTSNIGNIDNVDISKRKVESFVEDEKLNVTQAKFISISEEFIVTISSSLSNENQSNSNSLRILEKNFTDQLLYCIQNEHFEYGYENQADIIVKSFMLKNSTITKEWLNRIFIRYFNNSEIIIGILRLISRFDYEDMSPQGATMALASLSHQDLECKECAIRAFESWSTYESLAILRFVSVEDDWIKDYLNSVILDIECKYGITR